VRRSVQNNDNLATWRLAAYVFFALMPSARYSYHRWQSSFLPIAAQQPEWFRSIALASIDVRSFQILEIEMIGLPELLGFEDKNSMTYSIETRLPFLDYRLVEKAIALPVDLKIRDGWTKYVLRKAMSDLLPADLLWRRNKISFEAPTEIWLKRHREIMYEQVCASPLLRRLCGLRRLEQEFRKLGPNIQFRFYSVSLWEQIFNVTH
jgi:asparagine synthase (glutamine-hydrolysing)